MVTRVIGSGRAIEGGQLGTYKQDFDAHVTGGDFRHGADQIDMNPVLPDITGTTVQAVLEEMDTLIEEAGHNVVTVGSLTSDGYARGNYNVGSIDTPTFVNALNAAIADPQLAFGGIVLILAGLYHLTSSVTLPLGICLMGEIGGTIISGETTEQPMFVVNDISSPLGIGGDTGSGQVKLLIGSNYNQSKLYNLTLVDTWNGSTSSMTTVPMVRVKNGANLSCERVSFIGRINNGSITGRLKTFQALGTATGSGQGTSLSVTDCFFDGVKIGINFIPGNGLLDSLIVSRCKARTFGSETGADQTGESNSFIVATLCNSTITDNYVVGGGAFSLALITYTSSGAASVNSVISGNTGNTSNGFSSMVRNNSGQVLRATIANNNWNLSFESWYIVVSGANSQHLGDINGSSAIDVIFNLPSSFLATVYVYPGNYTITKQTNNNINFIGLKNGSSYPIFSLNAASSSTDFLGNKFITFGNYLQSIAFTSVGSIHSVSPSFNSSQSNPTDSVLKVEDCIFDDASLYPVSPGNSIPTDILGNTGRWLVGVNNCRFDQTGNFAVNVSCVLPPVHIASVEQCYFTGTTAYHLSIGNGYTIAETGIPNLYNIEKCYFELGGANAFSPLGANYSSVIVVEDYNNNPKISLKDCQILVSPAGDVTVGGWGGTILANTSYTGFYGAWIRLSGGDVNVQNCFINGSSRTTYTRSAVTYGTITLALEPALRVSVDNCYFNGGSVQMQIGGDDPFSYSFDGIFITNCVFNNYDQKFIQTCLDIDLNITATTNITSAENLPIKITNNSFFVNPDGTSGPFTAQHRNITSAIYNSCGCVQVYGCQADITFANNKVEALQYNNLNFANQAAVVLNNYDNMSTAGLSVVPISVSGNTIYCDNFVTSGTSTNSSAALYVRTNEARIENNHLNTYNPAFILSNFIGCLVADVQSTPSAGYGIVTGNVFSRNKLDGTVTSLHRGYIQLSNGGSTGIITNNVFSSPFITGSTTTLVEDNNVGPNQWTVIQNKNQSEVINIFGCTGMMANQATSSIMTVLGSYPTNLLVKLMFPSTLPNSVVELSYSSSSAAIFFWTIPLYEILPKNVLITKVTTTLSPSGSFSNALFNFTLTAVPLTVQNGSPVLDLSSGSPVTSTITPTNSTDSNTFYNTAANNIILTVSCTNITNGSGRTIDILPLTITYQW